LTGLSEAFWGYVIFDEVGRFLVRLGGFIRERLVEMRMDERGKERLGEVRWGSARLGEEIILCLVMN
jgi:hypothetical protein